jgi:hypothetical protein
VIHPNRRYGWASALSTFRTESPRVITGSLAAFVADASREQIAAWDDSIPPLQREVRELVEAYPRADADYTILEYELPLESRRPDVVFLSGGSVLVLELKGSRMAELAAVDQASAYARDLKAYHRECHDRPVHAVLVLTRREGELGSIAGVRVVGVDAVDSVVASLRGSDIANPIDPEAFLAPEAYSPLPTILEAARELFESRSLRRIHRAAAATEPAIAAVRKVAESAAATNTRHLIILTGIPGAGKTLVGLQVAHARYLDDLAVDRGDGRVRAPAVYLSGNGPLVEVLQYEFRNAAGGKAFVRDVKAYVERYTRNPRLQPDEHVLIYDEAQRAWDADQVAKKHGERADGRSEPEHFIEFAERIPGWSVVLALVGQGQEIHTGEEGGLALWRRAIDASATDWVVHAPSRASDVFSGVRRLDLDEDLHLHTEIRFHLAHRVDTYINDLLSDWRDDALAAESQRLEADGFHLRISRDLDAAKDYLWTRYRENPDARFGMITSSRDKELSRFGVSQSGGRFARFAYGPWYVEGDGDYLGRSCRTLDTAISEFGAQGLELDAALLAWGADFIRVSGRWSNDRAKRYLEPKRIRDAFTLRKNAYRVLLTRGRDGSVVFVPPIKLFDETFDYLVASGFRLLDSSE